MNTCPAADQCGEREEAGMGGRLVRSMKGPAISSLVDHGSEFRFHPKGVENALKTLNKGVTRMCTFQKDILAIVKDITGKYG